MVDGCHLLSHCPRGIKGSMALVFGPDAPNEPLFQNGGSIIGGQDVVMIGGDVSAPLSAPSIPGYLGEYK